MRCEICNKSETVPVVDSSYETHWYCYHCLDEIEETVLDFDDEDDWFEEDLVYLDDLYAGEEWEISEENQGVED